MTQVLTMTHYTALQSEYRVCVSIYDACGGGLGEGLEYNLCLSVLNYLINVQDGLVMGCGGGREGVDCATYHSCMYDMLLPSKDRIPQKR